MLVVARTVALPAAFGAWYLRSGRTAQIESIAVLPFANASGDAKTDYLSDGMSDENWGRATQKHYGYPSLAALQNTWLDWVRKGSPDVSQSAEVLAASDRRLCDRGVFCVGRGYEYRVYYVDQLRDAVCDF